MSLPGWASRDPEHLCPCVRSLFERLLDEAQRVEHIQVKVIETARDLERQKYYKAAGVSKTLNSYHLSQPPNNLSLAFDIAPEDYLELKGWNPGGELWEVLGTIGTDLGLEWGGDWSGWKDRPHFQLERCAC